MYAEKHCGKNPKIVCNAATYGALELPCETCIECNKDSSKTTKSNNMSNELAKQIITEYVFSEFDIKALYKFINSEINDETEKKLQAESLLTKALQKGVIALGKNKKKKESGKYLISCFKDNHKKVKKSDTSNGAQRIYRNAVKSGLYSSVILGKEEKTHGYTIKSWSNEDGEIIYR